MKTKPTKPIGDSIFNEFIKTRCSNFVRFLSVLDLANERSRCAAGRLRLRKTVDATALFAAMILMVTTVGRASVLAGPVINPTNGHVYYLLSENTWTASEAEAKALGGTLAIINDAAENDWIYSTFSLFGVTPRGLWIGLTDTNLEGTFVWVTGDPLVYTNWGDGEPNDNATGEDYAHIFSPLDGRAPGWNDCRDDPTGYIDGAFNGVAEISLAGRGIFCSGESVWESEGHANVSVMLLRGTNVTDQAFSVDYATADGTAHAGEDYVAASGTLHFATGETNKQITIQILNDGLKEPEEQFRLALSNPTGGVSLANSNAIIRIQDNDLGVRFLIENVVVPEVAGVVTLVVLRGDDLNLPFTVDYTTADGTARAGEDYMAASGTLHFAAGETNKLITITILDDELKESWEQFFIELSNPTGIVSLGSSNVAVRIQSDELVTYYVNVNNPNPAFPYTSWATAATNIQDAVDAAKSGDTVLVTNGVYATGEREGRVWEPTMEPPQFVSVGLCRVAVSNAIRLQSVNGPSVTAIVGLHTVDTNELGEVVGGSIGRCVYLGSNAVLSGFTLTNGSAYNLYYVGRGGGVLCENRSAAVTNCVMTGNKAGYRTLGDGADGGGGANGGTLYNCTLTGNSGGGAIDSALYNCTLTGNSTGYGGGASGCTLYNCTLTGNSGWEYGGVSDSTLYNCTLTGNYGYWGGGAAFSTLYNCTLSGNSGYYGGGASGCTLHNCTLTGNLALGNNPVGGGGAFRSTLYNCTVTDNSNGGVVSSTLYNCTVTGHDGGGVGYDIWGVGSAVFNSIVYYNYGGNYANGTILNYCCTTPLPTNGVGNITGPPLFMDMSAGDFRLREESPCIDAGTNLLGFPIAEWRRDYPLHDWVVVGHITDPTDILGNTRFIDGNFDGTVAWDIGAYEFRPNLAPMADASASRLLYISPNGIEATTILDGSRSSDPDGDPLKYLWLSASNQQPATVLASGVVAVVQLPVGVHPILLVVDDGPATATNAITIEVITTAQAVEKLSAQVTSSWPRSQPLIATLSAALASIERNNPAAAINQLQAFQNKVRAQVAPSDSALAASLIQMAQEIIAVLSGDNTNPGGRPHGRFTAVKHQPNGRVQMQFSAEPGTICILESSTNLVDWERIGVASDHGEGTFEFEDVNAAKFPNRFYRVVRPQ